MKSMQLEIGNEKRGDEGMDWEDGFPKEEYDLLTKIHYRIYIENQLRKLDTENHLPLSIIVADINGLKLINEILGFKQGDTIIIKVAQILKKLASSQKYLGRWGEDEFILLLPNTTEKTVHCLVEKMKDECSRLKVKGLQVDVAVGSSTRNVLAQSVHEAVVEAEKRMYRRKLLERNSVFNSIIASLLQTLGEKDYETEEHAWRMQKLGIQFGMALNLTDEQLDDLVLLISLHDIGKIGVPEKILMKPGSLTSGEWEIMKTHPLVGYRIAKASPELSHIATGILAHHERWDGKGYPKGLVQDQTPLLSRVVSIIDSYDVMTHDRPYKKAISREEALIEVQRHAGTQFDPDLVRIFIDKVSPNI